MLKWDDKVLTVDEVSQILRVLPKTVRSLLKEGKLPGIKVGRVWRIPEKALRTYLHSHKTTKPSSTIPDEE